MRISKPDALRPPSFMDAALKIVVITSELAVAYAGSVAAALDAIRAVAGAPRGVDEAAAVLAERQTGERREPAEYLVAGIHPARLLLVRSGAIEVRGAAWLGDQEAFEIYQREFLRERWQPPPEFWETVQDAEDMEIAAGMGAAMDAVVHGSRYAEEAGEQVLVTQRGGTSASVGEAVVSVVPRAGDGLFKYAEVNRAQSSGLQADLPPGLGVIPPDWGSPERGAFSYYMLVPNEPGVAAIGIYFIETTRSSLRPSRQRRSVRLPRHECHRVHCRCSS
jgi:hypothetical protein